MLSGLYYRSIGEYGFIQIWIKNVSISMSSAEETASQPSAIIEFSDKILEAAIRKAMNKPEGSITVVEAAAVTSLNLGNESFDDMNSKDGGIKDIYAQLEGKDFELK